jgi:hypothetical protein
MCSSKISERFLEQEIWRLRVCLIFLYYVTVQFQITRDAQKTSVRRAITDILVGSAFLTKIPNYQSLHCPRKIMNMQTSAQETLS